MITDLCRVYHDAPGIPNTLTDAHLVFLYHRILEEGLDKFVFHDGVINSFQKFKDLMRHPSVWSYAGFSLKDGEPLAMALIEGFIGKVAHLHFCFFKGEGFNNHITIGKEFIKFIFANSGLSCLMALTPLLFRHSWKFGLDVGFKELSIIPGACGILNHHTGEMKYRDGVLLQLNNPNIKGDTK